MPDRVLAAVAELEIGNALVPLRGRFTASVRTGQDARLEPDLERNLTPLDDCFPCDHTTLQREIAEKHLVISQFAAGSPVTKGNFPMRNRTMALISNATVIVEAGETSGTLHQGWEALRLGRPLFIMKSLVERQAPLKRTAEMLGHGAHVLAEMDDLLDVLPPPVVEDAHALAAAL